MLSRTDLSHCMQLKQQCENAYTMGRDEYPINKQLLTAQSIRYVDHSRVPRKDKNVLEFSPRKPR